MRNFSQTKRRSQGAGFNSKTVNQCFRSRFKELFICRWLLDVLSTLCDDVFYFNTFTSVYNFCYSSLHFFEIQRWLFSLRPLKISEIFSSLRHPCLEFHAFVCSRKFFVHAFRESNFLEILVSLKIVNNEKISRTHPD